MILGKSNRKSESECEDTKPTHKNLFSLLNGQWCSSLFTGRPDADTSSDKFANNRNLAHCSLSHFLNAYTQYQSLKTFVALKKKLIDNKNSFIQWFGRLRKSHR